MFRLFIKKTVILIKTVVLLCGSICLCLCGAFCVAVLRRTHHINTNICCHIATLPFL